MALKYVRTARRAVVGVAPAAVIGQDPAPSSGAPEVPHTRRGTDGFAEECGSSTSSIASEKPGAVTRLVIGVVEEMRGSTLGTAVPGAEATPPVQLRTISLTSSARPDRRMRFAFAEVGLSRHCMVCATADMEQMTKRDRENPLDGIGVFVVG